MCTSLSSVPPVTRHNPGGEASAGSRCACDGFPGRARSMAGSIDGGHQAAAAVPPSPVRSPRPPTGLQPAAENLQECHSFGGPARCRQPPAKYLGASVSSTGVCQRHRCSPVPGAAARRREPLPRDPVQLLQGNLVATRIPHASGTGLRQVRWPLPRKLAWAPCAVQSSISRSRYEWRGCAMEAFFRGAAAATVLQLCRAAHGCIRVNWACRSTLQ